jgi:eukaryotic translation initiation factor 2C
MPDQPAAVDARLTDASQDTLIAAFKSIRLQSDDLPLRPDFGTTGTQVKLRTNYFPVKVAKHSFFEYDVAINPAAGTAIRRVRRRIFELAAATPDWTRHGLRGKVAHDHSSKLIAASKLPQPLTIDVLFYDEGEDGPREGGKMYTLTFNFTQELETESLLQFVLSPFM